MKPKMDRTYLCEGIFNASEIAFSVLLPQDTLTSRYIFATKAYNISKRINGKPINAICFFMKKENSISVLSSGDTNYPLVYPVNDLLQHTHPNVLAFDEKRDECIIVVIHNGFEEQLIENVFDNLESDYASASIQQPYIRLNKKSDVAYQPRVVGVSIIKRP